jgi:hypothetical protein
MVSIARTHALVSINTSDKTVKPLSCTNSQFCMDQGLLGRGYCPQYCEIVVSAKRYSQNRRFKAEIDELSPERCREVRLYINNEGYLGISNEPSGPLRILPPLP